MYKKVVFSVLLLVFSMLYIAVRNSQQMKNNTKSFSDLQDRELVQIVFNKDQAVQTGQEAITVEIVNTVESTTLGLSGRPEIGTDGMLFIFPTKEVRYFWMKDMQFDIDIVWIADGKVVTVTPSVPKPLPETPDFRLETYSTGEPVNMVLELPSNDAQRLNISSGDVVQLVQ
ncbi:MAG: hypothetical protein BroJett025_10620 [Patescibacteria group bacterium]|nr:MAG: hypothetical protein BroJett025_10620 [Patescibacteria group bacterium]